MMKYVVGILFVMAWLLTIVFAIQIDLLDDRITANTEALNKQVREDIIPQAIKGLKVGDNISYIGACEVAPTDIPVKAFTIYPVEIKH